MEHKYSDYKFEDFLSDDYFIESIKNPTPKSIAFWGELIQSHLISENEYKMAVSFLQALSVKKQELSNEELTKMFSDFENRIASEKSEKGIFGRYFINYAKIASVIILVFVSTLYLFNSQNDSIRDNEISAIASTLKTDIKPDVTTLSTSEDEEILISEDESSITYSSQGDIHINNGEKVKSKDSLNKADQYNQLYVPKGKRSTLTFADGTKVWVNAGTRVIYPSNFGDDRREIYVDGEIYLDVVKNPDKPFIVKTKDLSIKVLGTSFNVNAYEDNTNTSVVLVNGSVEVDAKTKIVKLQPNQKFTQTDKNLSIENVDVEYYTLWKSGAYKFKQEKLSSVLEALSNYYGVKINCRDNSGNHICSGRLNLKDNVEYILNGFNKMLDIQWTYKNGEYIITNKQ